MVVLALVAVGAAGCSAETSRFDANPFASKNASSGDVTGSIGSSNSGRVESKPLPPAGHLPPPTQPAHVSGGVVGGGKGMASYQPGSADITGSVASSQPPAKTWDWDGGTAITVGQGDTLDTLSRRHGVPASAIMQANAITSPTGIRAGQRLVIPRYNQSGVTTSGPPATRTSAVQSAPGGDTHIIGQGETLTGIAKRYQVPLKDLARANNIEPYTQIKMGDRLTIPGRTASGARSAATQRPAQTIAQQKPAPAQKVASVESPHTARALTPAAKETADEDDNTKSASSATPAFRWPVRGRIITGFGPKPNGQQNDGINLAVPEGTPIKAAEDGVVAYSGNELKGYGNLVLIRHPNGFVTAYAHASELLVKRGDPIKRGQVIARSGQTGTVSSPQLHFEIRKGSSPVDPTQYLNGA